MTLFRLAVAAAGGVALGCLVNPALAQDSVKSFRADGTTPRLQIFSPDDMRSQRSRSLGDNKATVALEFLRENAATYNLPSDLSNLQQVGDEERTLLGSVLRFRQRVSGLDIDTGEIVVSVNEQNQVYSVFNNLVAVPESRSFRASTPQITAERAYDIAWTALGVQGDPSEALHSAPQEQLKYVTRNQELRLVYVIDLYVTRRRVGLPPRAGQWQVLVDALDGSLLGEPVEKTVREGKREGDGVFIGGNASDRRAAFDQFFATDRAAAFKPPARRTNGTGFVFDADPVTTLADPSLKNDSPAGRFERAYDKVTLNDISIRDGRVYLEGPYVTIADFELPKMAPSFTSNGVWTAKRGANAFYDVMTYFHIDKTQRYLQSLGYTGNRAIQGNSILADSNGVNGDDNSHYIPLSNRIAFGHGCIPDNEDAGVILHEYGHAITHAINPKWDEGDGDSGAIGEGFGDYWSATYRSTTRNGDSFQIENVFNWDTASGCYDGRHLNMTAQKYDPKRHYEAHQAIGSGAQSDELWSTPLYQSFQQLRKTGVAREDIDKVVLESMFGLSAGFTMRDLATKVVSTANLMYPGQPHARVFQQNFEKLNILAPSAVKPTEGIPISKCFDRSRLPC